MDENEAAVDESVEAINTTASSFSQITSEEQAASTQTVVDF